jgi:hypothetical protein
VAGNHSTFTVPISRASTQTSSSSIHYIGAYDHAARVPINSYELKYIGKKEQ